MAEEEEECLGEAVLISKSQVVLSRNVCFAHSLVLRADSALGVAGGAFVDVCLLGPWAKEVTQAIKAGGSLGDRRERNPVLTYRMLCAREARLNQKGLPVLRCEQMLGLRRDAGMEAAQLACKRARVPKTHRFSLFAQWLCGEFGGQKGLSTGSGVLDVAGGAGALSEAVLSLGVRRVTLVEPCPGASRGHDQAPEEAQVQVGMEVEVQTPGTRAVKGEEGVNRAEEGCDSICDDSNCNNSNSSNSSDNDHDPSSPQRDGDSAEPVPRQGVWQRLQTDPATRERFKHVAARFEPHAWQHGPKDEALRGVWEAAMACSVVVGMHPDQATEPIVEFAVQHNKPFAVVPCCVFHCEFPQRRQFWKAGGDGMSVRQYSTFLDYLEALARQAGRQVHRAKLPITGRNTILFSHASPA